MAEKRETLKEFLGSLVDEKANNLQAKELELARTKNKLRRCLDRERKQKQRVREMVASLKVARDENDWLRSEILRIQTEMTSLTVGLDVFF